MEPANEALLDTAVSHAIGTYRFGSAVVRKVLALLRRMEPRLAERLSAEDVTAFSQARLEALLSSIRRIVADNGADTWAAVEAELRDFAAYEGEYQTDALADAVPVRLNYTLPDAPQLVAAAMSRPFQGRIMREWFADLEATTFARLRDTIRQGFVEGQSIARIVQAVRGTRSLGYKDGVMEINRRAAETVVRTAVNHTANAAREIVFEANADIIKGVRWVSTLDGRTSAVCRARDGQVYKPKEGPRPPAHPNCRSATVPVLKSWREMGLNLADAPAGTRASLDGQVPADLTYGAWLAKKPAAFQDEVLGETKARLFRDGGLTLDRFVDTTGREYSLAELRRRDAAAFQRAGLSTVSA